jgi:hypothetical protein
MFSNNFCSISGRRFFCLKAKSMTFCLKAESMTSDAGTAAYQDLVSRNKGNASLGTSLSVWYVASPQVSALLYSSLYINGALNIEERAK